MAEMMPQSALVPDSDYIIIGGTGDLALRKIFPALFWRFLDGQVTSSFRLIAAARQEISKKDFADRLRPFCEEALYHADTKDTDFELFLKLVQLSSVTGWFSCIRTTTTTCRYHQRMYTSAQETVLHYFLTPLDRTM